MKKKSRIKAGFLALTYPMWDVKQKKVAGRPPKKSTLLKMLWKGYPSMKAMRKAKLRKVI